MGYLDKAGLSRAFTKLKTLIDNKQDKMKTIGIPSSSSTNKNKWIKFATIDLSSAGAWQACSGTLSFCINEGASALGLLKFRLRNGGTAGTVGSNSLTWVSLSSNNYASSVATVKVSNGKYDIYYKPINDYETPYVSLIDCYYTSSFTFNTGSYVASITAASTSSVSSYANIAGSANAVAWGNVTSKPNLMQAKSENGYWGMAKPDGTNTDWIRTTSAGIIPYQSGSNCALGTSSWKFNEAYINTVHGALDGNAKTATSATTATTATQLSASAGSATQPVYFSGGKPVATTYTLGKSVPSNAVFTDTTYSDATASAHGLMTAADKQKLDALGGITTITKSLTLTTAWADTGISGTNLDTGTYVVQISGLTSDDGLSTWAEIWSGVMSWYAGTTNSTNAEEILLHNAGHADNSGEIYLRTIRTSGGSYLKLQIASNIAATKADSIVFKFRKLI